MTTLAQTPQNNLMLERVAGEIAARTQVTVPDLCEEFGVTPATLRKFTRELEEGARIHKVRGLNGKARAGGIWAPGPAPRDDEGLVPEPVRLRTRNWKPTPIRRPALEAHFFNRMMVEELRA